MIEPTPKVLGEYEKAARSFLRTLRRRRQAGLVKHGETMAIPTKHARFPTRRSR